MIFQWEDENIDHIGEHGVEPIEARYVAEHPRPPFPEEAEDEKLLVWGQTEDGRFLQVVYIYLEDDEVDFASLSSADRVSFEQGESVAYIIHARDLTHDEKRRYRRRVKS